MAIFHLTAKVISRGKGQSAIAAAAYRPEMPGDAAVICIVVA
jgi:hypothetical protein